MKKLKIAIFDVNQTIFNLKEIENRFLEKKIKPEFVETWFALTLKEGFALSNIGKFVDFKTIALNQLKNLSFSKTLLLLLFVSKHCPKLDLIQFKMYSWVFF